MAKKLTDAQREMLSAYVDGELDRKQSNSVELQLSKDPEVRHEVEAIRRTWDLLDCLPKPKPSADFTSKTVERLTGILPKPKVELPKQPKRWWYSAGWAAGIVFALILGYGIGSRNPRPDPAVEERMVRDLRTIEKLRMYEAAEDIEFLHMLANPNDPDLFGDDGHGS